MIAALVAAAGLAVSAWGTLKSAQVADDQLAQSREEQEKGDRAQASAVTVWLEGFGEEDEALILANRSLHPVPVEVYGMRIHYKRTTPHDDTVESISQGHEIVLGVLPPCSRVTFTHDLLMRNSADEDPESPFPRVDDFDPDGIVFMDATGQKWRRGLSGKLSRASDIQLPLAFYDFDELDVGTPIRETKPAKLTPCSVQ